MLKNTVIISIFCVGLSGHVNGAHANYSKKQSIFDTINSFWGSQINCIDCEAYLPAVCKHVNACIDQKLQTIKESLGSAGQYVMHEQPYFSHGVHEAQFDPEKYKDKKILICSKCIAMLSEYTPDGDRKFPLELSRLEDLAGSAGGEMIDTSYQGTRFGSVYAGMTPLWQDVFTTVKENAMSAAKLNFLELGSGFNTKPLALWGREQGKANCTVNDINSDNCLSFIKSYLLLDPRDIKASHEQSFIILSQGDFLEGKFSTGQKYDVVVITNVFHYFTKSKAEKAMAQLKLMTKPDSIVYIQAFSGTDENHEVNPFLKALGGFTGDDEPLYIDNPRKKYSDFTDKAIQECGGDKVDQVAFSKLMEGSFGLPAFFHKYAAPLSFYPVGSLKKLAQGYGFQVMTSGLFQVRTAGGDTSDPQKTPYFAWVKLKKL